MKNIFKSLAAITLTFAVLISGSACSLLRDKPSDNSADSTTSTIQKDSLFDGDKLTVPELIGLNYEEEIKHNSNFREFEFVIQEISNSTYPNGYVLNQQPSHGSKVDKDENQIIIYVVSNPQKPVIPEVVGENYELAQKMLESKGFKNIKLVPMISSEQFGNVIQIEPKEGEEVDSDTLIIVYFASDEAFVEVSDVSHNE